jgi:hypothetical protein
MRPQSRVTYTCALFSSNNPSNSTMQAQVPPSVRSSKYRKYGAFPAVASILATCNFVECLQGVEQIENWIYICPKSAAVCKEVYKYHASLQIGTDKCFERRGISPLEFVS